MVGGDVRLTSESLKLALARGLMDAGTDVLDIGLERHGRDLLRHFPPRGGRRYRGDGEPQPDELQRHELVRENAKPISGDTGLRDIQRLAEENQFPPVDPARRGALRQISVLKEVRRPPDGLRGPGELHPSAEAGGELWQRGGGARGLMKWRNASRRPGRR